MMIYILKKKFFGYQQRLCRHLLYEALSHFEIIFDLVDFRKSSHIFKQLRNVHFVEKCITYLLLVTLYQFRPKFVLL